MPKLYIDIMPQLLVYKFIAKLFGNILRYNLAFFGFKNHIDEIRIFHIRHLMDIKKM